MNFQAFIMWLMDKHGMTERSAKDVYSRLKRIMKMTNIDEIDEVSLDYLKKNEEYNKLSQPLKSQLKRALVLYEEFKSLEK